MLDALTLGQLALSSFLLAVIAERAHYLLYRAPLSAVGLAWLRERLQAGDRQLVQRWAGLSPHTHAARLLTLSDPAERTELLSELGAEATARLRVIRVGATMASTVGLLIGIVRLRAGFGGSSGLLALQQGLAQRVAMSEALFSMGVGVGTSAVCFYALGGLRRAARDLLQQTTRLANQLENGPPPG